MALRVRTAVVWLLSLPMYAQAQAATAAPDPMPNRPPCLSYFLKEEAILGFRQKTCDWVMNRMFSMDALAGAAWSAGFAQVRELASDHGKGTTGFSTRFATNFAQGAAKSTGAYLGGLILREDARRMPPYVYRPKLSGFGPRLRRALSEPLLSYRCTKPCANEEDVHRVPAFSRVAGAFASGYSSRLWAPDRVNTPGRALRRTASAYGGSFSSSLLPEFKPELIGLLGSVARAFGVK